MIHGLAARAGGLDRHRQILLDFLLPDEFRKRCGTQLQFERRIVPNGAAETRRSRFGIEFEVIFGAVATIRIVERNAKARNCSFLRSAGAKAESISVLLARIQPILTMLLPKLNRLALACVR